jgi:hypothetical protein
MPVCRCRERQHKKIDAVFHGAGQKPTRLGGQSMFTHEYVICQVDDLWHVRRDGRLVTGQPSQMDALSVAQSLASAAAARGERSRILVGELDGHPIEFSVIEPAKRRA